MKNLESKTFRPRFLDDSDQSWVLSIIQEYRRMEGRPLREWRQRLREPFPFYCPHYKLRFVIKALEELAKKKDQVPRNKIRELRQTLFYRSERLSLPSSPEYIFQSVRQRREQILENMQIDLALGIEREQAFDSLLFSDLPSEQSVGALDKELTHSEILLVANSHLVRSIIQRSERLDILIRGHVRPIVRQAMLRGLICIAKPLSGNRVYDAVISLSGPLGIFRHSRLYGRYLMEIMPFLANCDSYSLKATVPDAKGKQAWVIQSGDPIKPVLSPKFDSQIERRFERDFKRATKDFDLVREPQAVQAGTRLIFPDFSILHRTNPNMVWMLEIVGYWTETYLRKKIDNLNAANIQNLIICVSKRLGNSDQWPSHARVVYFDRWIDVNEILKILEELCRVRLSDIKQAGSSSGSPSQQSASTLKSSNPSSSAIWQTPPPAAFLA